MTDEITDTVIASVPDEGGATLRLADWTPYAAYEALTAAALNADIDIDTLSDGEEVGTATVTEDGKLLDFSPDDEYVTPETNNKIVEHTTEAEFDTSEYVDMGLSARVLHHKGNEHDQPNRYAIMLGEDVIIVERKDD